MLDNTNKQEYCISNCRAFDTYKTVGIILDNSGHIWLIVLTCIKEGPVLKKEEKNYENSSNNIIIL